EMDTAENDDVGIAPGCQAGQGQTVAHVVGHVLNPGDLVVVSQDHRIAGLSQGPHLARPLVKSSLAVPAGNGPGADAGAAGGSPGFLVLTYTLNEHISHYSPTGGGA